MQNVYQEVTDRIIAELEKGAAPWVKPWKADATADHNVASKKAYQGINRLLLGMASMAAGYESSTWGTFQQWKERGTSVKKGEKATHIVFFKPVAGEQNAETGETSKGFCVIKGYCVFNQAQTDMGSTLPLFPEEAASFDPLPACEANLIKSGARITHGGDAAFFAPALDRIQLPNRTTFDTPAAYYATAFHELTHWTGHKDRLDRNQLGRFGNPAYAFEELIAEMGAAFLCADHSVQGELRHAGYIGHWLHAMRADNKAVFKAAALAQKAADYIRAQDATAEAIAA